MAVVHPCIDAEWWEYLRFEYGEAFPFELIDGEAVVTVPQSHWHSGVARALANAVSSWAETQTPPWFMTADVLLRFGASRIAPDIALWRAERRPALDEGRLDRDALAPDLVAEVFSPSTVANDLGPKRSTYLEHGCEVWLVNPADGAVTVDAGGTERVLRPGDELTSALLPGFTLDVERLRGER